MRCVVVMNVYDLIESQNLEIPGTGTSRKGVVRSSSSWGFFSLHRIVISMMNFPLIWALAWKTEKRNLVIRASVDSIIIHLHLHLHLIGIKCPMDCFFVELLIIIHSLPYFCILNNSIRFVLSLPHP